jgi:hypothetical protein
VNPNRARHEAGFLKRIVTVCLKRLKFNQALPTRIIGINTLFLIIDAIFSDAIFLLGIFREIIINR